MSRERALARVRPENEAQARPLAAPSSRQVSNRKSDSRRSDEVYPIPRGDFAAVTLTAETARVCVGQQINPTCRKVNPRSPAVYVA